MSNHNGRGPGPVPDRWLHCPRKSLYAIEDKFLAFKTPLSEDFDDQVPVENRFPPSMIFDFTRNKRMKIGLWIDLTNTSRFYNSMDVVDGYNDPEFKVAYVKVQCRGHGETPSRQQADDFIQICRNYISQHPLQVIGVHCTHGFNRTGFLIVSFLVEEMNWSVAAAIAEFAKARPPGIYKEDYIQELYRRYDEDGEPVPPPPPRPDWCFMEENNHTASGSSNNRGEKRKFNEPSTNNHKSMKTDGKVPTFMEGIYGVSPVTDRVKLSSLQATVKDLCQTKERGFPGSQPVSMDLENITLLQEKPYVVSWKADGTRYMMLILRKDEIYCIDRDNNYFHVSGLTFYQNKRSGEHLESTVLDGEMVIDKHEGKSIPRYLVYDIIVMGGKYVGNLPFQPQRVDCIHVDIIKPRNTAIGEGRIDKLREPFSVRLKPFYPLEKASSFFSAKFCQQLSHEPDGLIFQPSKDPYKMGQSPSVLKWKPPSHNSVDFKLIITREEGQGILPKKVCYLYVGGSNSPFAQMKFSNSIKDMHNKIVECTFVNNAWTFMRERTDKSFPNSYKTAMSVCNSIKHPVTKGHLLNFIEHSRYKRENELMPPPPIHHGR